MNTWATRDATGKGIDLSGGVDTTQRKLAEIQQRNAERREKDFLAILGHELRSPLASLQNGLAILDASDSVDLSVKTRALMRRQVGRMKRLIDDLMDVSRIASGKVQLKKARVFLKTIIDEAVESSLTAINDAGHTVNIDIPGDAIVNADSTHLSQVFCNLLNNAAKYTPRGGHIKVTAEKQGCIVTVRVTDNGDGMEPQALSSIFKMYDQAGGTVDHAQGGLGIGLAIAKNLTAMHEGSIHAESPGLGKGSTFIVQLPLATMLRE
jgi:signal transduction histidine kinase